MRELELNVNGIKCSGCENRIIKVISEIKAVQKVSASHETGKVSIILKKDLDNDIKSIIINSIEKIGFEVEK